MAITYLGRLGSIEVSSDVAYLSVEQAQMLDDAQSIIDAAHEEAVHIHRDARDRGYDEGMAAGQAEIASALAAVHLQADRYVRDMEPALVDCVVNSARLLVGETGQVQLLEHAVLHVRERLADKDGLVIRVAPDKVAGAQEAVNHLARNRGLVLEMRVVPDVGLSDDDCIIESSLGRAEVRLEEQLERLRAAVMRELESAEVAR